MLGLVNKQVEDTTCCLALLLQLNLSMLAGAAINDYYHNQLFWQIFFAQLINQSISV